MKNAGSQGLFAQQGPSFAKRGLQKGRRLPWAVSDVRERLGREVRSASPLLLDVCPADLLDELVWNWRETLAVAPTFTLHVLRHAAAGLSPHAFHFRVDLLLNKEPFVGIRSLRIQAGELHADIRLGRCWIRTRPASARLVLSERLPEVAVTAMADRSLDAVVGHELFTRRGYRVLSAFNPSATGAGTAILFEAAPVAWRLPWAR